MASSWHVAIAGSTAEAQRLASSFEAAGETVTLADCGEAGQLGGTNYVVALCDTDQASFALAEAAVAAAPPGLQAFARIVDPELYARLSDTWFRCEPGAPQLDVVQPIDVAARLVLEHHPVAEAGSLAIVGTGALARSLFVQAARDRYWAHRDHHNVLPITLVAADAEELVASLRRQAPSLDHFVRIRTATSANEAGVEPSATVVITSRDVPSALSALRDWTADASVPASVVCVPEGEQELRSRLEGADPVASAFGVAERVYTRELVLSGTRERLAQATHAAYVHHQAQRGGHSDAADDWRDLPETLKQSNRSQADDVPRKLAELGWSVKPALFPDPDREPPEVSPELIERLARGEHLRWMDERRTGQDLDEGNGGSESHRLLVPWSELSETEREKDRDTIRDLPWRLAVLGFEVVQARASGGEEATTLDTPSQPEQD